MPIVEESWGSLPPGPVSVAASGCKPKLSHTAMAAYLLGAFAASAGMVRMVQRCDPVFEWVFVIVELRP